MTILVTGGAGYIGSHTVLTLLENGREVIVLDNLSNSSSESLQRVLEITKSDLTFIQGDVLDRVLLKDIFRNNSIEAVIHFAGLKSVGQSLQKPIEYYKNNVAATLILLEEMESAGIKKFIFSSSATVYGSPEFIPLTEKANIGGTTNPYGTSKLMIEQILDDLCLAKPDFHIIALRYFNPIGAHPSGMIGEDPLGIPNNLLPFVCLVAAGKLPELLVYGNDYPTTDGTGVRDYIHVMDLAEGHLQALNSIEKRNGYRKYNLGTGIGYSVLEMIKMFERVSGRDIPYRIVSRRAGDIAECWSDPSLAYNELGWKAKRNLESMLKDTWRWQRLNPTGFSK